MARRDFTTVRDKFARDDGLPFGRLLSREYVLSMLAGHKYRSRVFCPLVTLWGWLSQCLSQDKSLNETVLRILAHRASMGLPTISASSASYSDARTRFGNRPGRVEPRFKKRRPAWTDYMTIPRHKSKRRLNRDARAIAC